MKKVLVFILATMAVAGSVLAEQKTVRRRPNRLSKPSGGIIEKHQESKVFRVLNTTTVLPEDKVAALTRDIRYAALLPIEVQAGTKIEGCPFEAANKLVNEQNVAAGVLVVDDAKLPITLVAPDRKWSILNIAAIKADAPSAEKLFERFTKVYWGAIARTLGAGNSSYPGCVLVPFTTMAQLDAIKVLRPCPEPFNKMIDTGNALGMKTLTIATYRTACKQGWAPDPDTPERKAIWDEIHQLPTEPIKILPEKNKVTQ